MLVNGTINFSTVALKRQFLKNMVPMCLARISHEHCVNLSNNPQFLHVMQIHMKL